jgi:hypothetical protein
LANAYAYDLIHVHEENVPAEIWPELKEMKASGEFKASHRQRGINRRHHLQR